MFTPRLNDKGIRGNPFWYDDNEYYKAGYGMPNCTAYALGRWYELQGSPKSFNFSHYGNGQDWYEMGVNAGYEHSKTIPKLGAAISWTYPTAGHVAIVEEIAYKADGSIDYIITSNSAWQSTFFYLQTLYADDGYIWKANSTLNGFIYHPSISPTPPTPPTPTPNTSRKLPLWFMLRPF